jgi:hypothetical protein
MYTGDLYSLGVLLSSCDPALNVRFRSKENIIHKGIVPEFHNVGELQKNSYQDLVLEI